MKKFFTAALALLFAATALGQSYPSPTYNNLTVQGTLTLSSGLPLMSLAAQAANTVVANVTAASASPTAVAIPSCSTANSALKYTTASGLSCGTAYALTSGTLAQFASTTSAQLAGVLSDETGTGSAVFATGSTINPTSTGAATPGSGAFTTLSASGAVSGAGFTTLLSPYLTSSAASATYCALAGCTFTGAVTPSQTAGIVGTTTNNNANAGSVGERFDPTAGSTSITSSTATNIVSQSLTAGDWDCSGIVYYLMGTGATSSVFVTSISTTSATQASPPMVTQLSVSTPTSGAISAPTPVYDFQLTTATTIYLVGYVQFSGGSVTTQGRLHCRRSR